eukprot:TRINITY_DN10107_c0_g1_i1.p1 TRINITY_DN10107_c0_g1~~TRINITY_DN10107_c0_g1_i1.p1  ORF type:complete len:295 (-),score=26.57 TRINITY_DN10107_c0_g1_i1:86-970(-)
MPDYWTLRPPPMQCPICAKDLPQADASDPNASQTLAFVNNHIDECLSRQFLEEESKPASPPPKPSYPAIPQSQTRCGQCGVVAGHLTTCTLFSREPDRLEEVIDVDAFVPPPPPPFNPLNHQATFQDLFRINSDPTNVICPYTNCGTTHKIASFVNHVNMVHVQDGQAYACPICPKLGYEAYHVTQKTNLLEHINGMHADMAVEYGFEDGDDFYYDPTEFETPEIQRYATYMEEKITRLDTVQECGICYEEYNLGDIGARLQCLCLYHKTCLEKWFEKTRGCPLHHRDDAMKES